MEPQRAAELGWGVREQDLLPLSGKLADQLSPKVEFLHVCHL